MPNVELANSLSPYPMAAFKLRVLRINAGFTREGLAKAAGVSHPTIKALEEDANHRPGVTVAHKIASVFDLQVTDIWPELARNDPPRAKAA